MPRLYLELLENKAKVRPELRSKEHVPKNSSTLPSLSEAETKTKNLADTLSLDDEKDLVKVLPKSTAAKKGKPLKIIDVSELSNEELQERIGKKEPKSSSIYSFEEPKPSSPPKGVVSPSKELSLKEAFKLHISPIKEGSDMQGSSRREERGFEEDYDRSYRRHKEDRYREERSREEERDYRKKDYRAEEERPKEPDRIREEKPSASRSDISSIIAPAAASTISLEELLMGKDHPGTQRSREGANVPEKPPEKSTTSLPPSLGDIEAGRPLTDANGIRDISRVTDAEKALAGKKRDIQFKFKILRRVYKEANIPEFPEHTSLETLEREYESIVRQVALEATVANYQKYLTIGFFVLEFVLGSFFKLEDIKGFTQQQLLGMNQYEKILWELGEKAHLSNQKQWSPEFRLVGIILLNGAIFIGTKMLFRATGANIMNMLNPQGNQASHSYHGGQPQAQGTKPKMRGPDIDLGNIGSKKQS